MGDLLYWQYFCSEAYVQHALPIDPSKMTRFRQRIEEAGCSWLLELTIVIGLETKRIQPAQLAQISEDATVQPKVVASPTNAQLCVKGLRTVVREAKRAGLTLRQGDTRVAAQAFLQNGRVANAKPMNHVWGMQKNLTGHRGRVYRDVQRKLAACLPSPQHNLHPLLTRSEGFLTQQHPD